MNSNPRVQHLYRGSGADVDDLACLGGSAFNVANGDQAAQFLAGRRGVAAFGFDEAVRRREHLFHIVAPCYLNKAALSNRMPSLL